MKSIVSYPERGFGGSNKWRGNCSPQLIEDLIKQFNVHVINDYMKGSGTTEDVAKRLGIESHCYDLKDGFDLLNMDVPQRSPELTFWHPPYHDIIQYSDNMYRSDDVMKKYGIDPKTCDLSRMPSWESFISAINACTLKLFNALDSGSRLAILCGDIRRKGNLYSMPFSMARPGKLEAVVIKEQWNCMSDRRVYSGNFIPIVHEYLMILKKEASLIYDINFPLKRKIDVRDMQKTTWRDVVIAVYEASGKKRLSLNELYHNLENHDRAKTNQFWKEKVRQTVQRCSMFRRVDDGVWELMTA